MSYDVYMIQYGKKDSFWSLNTNNIGASGKVLRNCVITKTYLFKYTENFTTKKMKIFR